MDADFIPRLIHLLGDAELDIRKESAWAISNATSGGSPDQIKFLVEQGCVPPLAELLTVADPRIVVVALEGLEVVRRTHHGFALSFPHSLTLRLHAPPNSVPYVLAKLTRHAHPCIHCTR